MASVIELRYQTFWPRFWAGWIDFAVFFPLLFFDFWLEDHVQSPIFLALWLVAYTLSFDVYSVAMHAKCGQTLGKMVMHVKVLDVSEKKLSLRQAVLRECISIVLNFLFIADDLPRVLSGVSRTNEGKLDLMMQIATYGSLLWFAVELLSMLMNSKRRALHDLIAGSVVVHTRLESA